MLSYVRGRFIDRASDAAATVNLRHNPTAISIANFEKHVSSATQSSLTQIKWISIFSAVGRFCCRSRLKPLPNSDSVI